MTGWTALDRFLHTDPRDVGCAEAMDMLHVYAELLAVIAGEAPCPSPAPDRVAGASTTVRSGNSR